MGTAWVDTTELVIGEAPQYFFDDGIVESVQNVTRTIHRPVKAAENPLLVKDRPWEHVPYFGSADFVVWRDADTGQFRCLYTDWDFDREKLAETGGTCMDWGITLDRQLYARSDEGLRWEKPAMGVETFAGQDTNVVFGGESDGTVWNLTLLDDPLESDPERRYKALYSHVPPGTPPEDGMWQSMRAAHSPDGVRWTPYGEPPVFGSVGARLGDVAIAAFDPATSTYLLNTRHPRQEEAPSTETPRNRRGLAGPSFDTLLGLPARRARRRIFQCESRDFLHWSAPRLILAPDPELDNVDDAFYGMNPLYLGGQWVGFLDVFHMVANTVDVQLVHSRDGRNWRRVAAGHPWLEPGRPGSWDQFMAYHVHGFPVGDELWLYYGGARNHHDWWISGPTEGLDVPEARDMQEVGYGLGLARLRLDGFVSLGANRVREGLITTQPFVSTGERLTINAACGREGYLRVELCDIAGEPVPGRSFADCDVFTGDSVQQTVSWGGETTLPPAGGSAARPAWRRLRFLLRDSELYSFRFGAVSERS